MSVTRRSFLGALIAAGVVTVAPNPGIPPIGQRRFTFDPTAQYGRAVSWPGRADAATRKAISGALQDDARRLLPPGTRYQLRMRSFFDWGRDQGMAWYYTPEFATAATWDRWEPKAPEYNFIGGYFLVGRYTA